MPEHNTWRAVNLAVIATHPPSPVDWPDVEPDEEPTPDAPFPDYKRRGPRRVVPVVPIVQLPGPEGPMLPLH